MASRSGGEILVGSLLAQEATHAFGVPGESYLAVLDAFHDVADRLRFVVCRHEGGASYMAEAFGKLTGRPGIAFATRGPGASNAAIGIHTSHQDSSPMILFVGQVGSDTAERDSFQEIDYRRMYGASANGRRRSTVSSAFRSTSLMRIGWQCRAARAPSSAHCPKIC